MDKGGYFSNKNPTERYFYLFFSTDISLENLIGGIYE